MPETATIACDLLVVGGGMAGMTAAGWAAERGARVIVVEKAPAIGGSALLSGGVVWTASSRDKMALYGGGDAALGDVVFDTYPDGIAWLRERGVQLSPRIDVLHGQGYQVDLAHHFRACASAIAQHGGHVIPGTETVSLTQGDDGGVTGAVTAHPDGEVRIEATATVLATGGYQASPALRARHIHPQAHGMLLRSNRYSDGAGLRLGEAAGGEIAGRNRGFYGHLVSKPDRFDDERLFVALSQYHSEHALLLNEAGARFCDESYGDHANTAQTVRQPGARALCVWDSRVHAAHACTPVVSVGVPMDKMQVALEHGGEGVVADDLATVAAFADAHGFDGTAARASIERFNRDARHGWERLDPPRTDDFAALDRPPFYALVVYPAITFTFGGLTIDSAARVLRADGRPVPGLFAAGADAGGAYGRGYAGGLAMAMAFGITAARTAGWA